MFHARGGVGGVKEKICLFRLETVAKRLPKNSKTRRGSRIQPVQCSLGLCLKKFHESMLT